MAWLITAPNGGASGSGWGFDFDLEKEKPVLGGTGFSVGNVCFGLRDVCQWLLSHFLAAAAGLALTAFLGLWFGLWRKSLKIKLAEYRLF